MKLLNLRTVMLALICMPALAMAYSPKPMDVPGTGVYPANTDGTPQYPVKTAGTPKKTHAFPESKSYAEDTSLYKYVPPEPLGKTTRSLLAMQADMNRPGNPHTMLGATANNAWGRYLNSFNHAIPEWFEEKIEEPGD